MTHMTLKAISVGAASLVLAGCWGGVGPDYVAPASKAPEAFLASSDRNSNRFDPPPSEWWKALKDPQLNGLVERARQANNDIAAARANLTASRAAARAATGAFFPSVNAAGSAQRTKPSGAAQGLPEQPAVDLYDAGFDASWELDLFGGINRSTQAARADAQAAEARLQDVLVSVTADTVRAYIDLRGVELRLDVAQRNAENQQRTYDLTVDLSNGGRGSELDVARAQSQLETTRAAIAALEAGVTTARFRLAVLVGEVPQTFTLTEEAEAVLPVTPEVISIGEPADLLRRRPDVRQAERALEAATARIGVATAELFPRLSLTGAVGLSALSFDNLSEQAAFQYSVGPSLVWNLFAGGASRARIAQADALAQAQLARYDNTVLLALEDAEASLTRFAREKVRLGHLSAAALASARAADFADQRYRGGVDNFLNVLDAQRSLLAAEDSLVQSQVAVATQFIAVHKALGTGWQPVE
ncbi:MAG: efflux transporter outer membrane subunit [Rhodospirillaceae bacterium]|nr:efflux transporter outer membrane subunit [Rhodospirillaceae bacterium]